ncbi:slipin family protein [Marinigracilibium pacificum]|uniref:Slipin family protein n=1 Tax=Marinigracilibium pacificum TaxID=2729599 RepID=A0A848J6E3_9BACT|nr:slipin family protein [Marinigracilibium pacificum]NMM49949.1 slipin family protein [Marinigracilibium pacificum]
MKRIRINAGKIGLIFKKGDFQRVISRGAHWLAFGESVEQYDLTRRFNPVEPLELYLNESSIIELIHLINVGDNQIVLKYENGNFTEVLKPGRYAFWKGLIEYNFKVIDLTKTEIEEEIELLALKRSELVPYIRVSKIESFENGILFLNGKAIKVLTPGEYYFWKNSVDVSVSKVDLRQQQMEVSGQEILTKDKASLRVSFYVQYKVIDISKALVDNKDFEKQFYVLIQFALREYIGSMTLDQLLEDRDNISRYVFNFLETKVMELGIEVKGGGLRDVILPGEMKTIMNQVLVAQKQAQANVITRREETASTRSLLNTAKLMEENEMLFKLKEMEYVEKIAEKVGEISLNGNGQMIDQLKAIFSGVKLDK